MSHPDFAPYGDSPNALIVSGFITCAANHEAKTIISGVYLQQPGELLRPAEVARTTTELQGEDPAWRVPTKDVIQYSERSLAKGGIVESGTVMGKRSHEVTAWGVCATLEDQLVLRALVGFFSSWGLEFPDESVQRLYRVGGGDQAKAPLVRHRLYDLLCDGSTDHSIEGLNTAMIQEGHHPRTLGVKLEHLDQQGIVEVRTKNIRYDPLVRVVDSRYRHVAIKFSDTSLETQAVYAAMQELGEDATISVNELIDVAMRILPSADPVVMRNYLMGSFSTGTHHFPGLELVDRRGMPVSGFSVVKLAPEVQQAVNELVVGVGNILAGEDLPGYAKRAQRIMENPSLVRALMAKAGRFSAVKAGHLHGVAKLARQMGAILGMGPQTAESMRAELAARHGRLISHERIRVILNELIDAGEVMAADEAVHPHSAITRKVYRLGAQLPQ